MNITQYIKETRGELKHVAWPNRKELVTYTISVIVVSIGVAVFLAIVDASFKYLLSLTIA